jgi:hypothetical protein
MLVVLALVLAACGDSPTAAPEASTLIPGTYAIAPASRLDLTATSYRRQIGAVVDSGRVEMASAPNVYRLVGGEPSTVQQWDATHVLVTTSWVRTLWTLQ